MKRTLSLLLTSICLISLLTGFIEPAHAAELAAVELTQYIFNPYDRTNPRERKITVYANDVLYTVDTSYYPYYEKGKERVKATIIYGSGSVKMDWSGDGTISQPLVVLGSRAEINALLQEAKRKSIEATTNLQLSIAEEWLKKVASEDWFKEIIRGILVETHQ